MKRTVVFLKPWLGIGGADRWTVDAALALQGAGWDAAIWTNRNRGGTAFPEVADGRVRVEVRAPAEPGGLFDRFRVWRVIARQAALLRAMEREGRAPDLVVCDVAPHVVPWVKRRWPGAAVLVYCHFPDALMAPAGGPLYRAYRLPLDRLERRAIRAADLVAANSRFTADAMRRAYPELGDKPVPVVYPGVAWPERAERAGARGRVFLTVARFDPRKGIGLSLEALAALRARVSAEVFSACRLVVAGGCDESLREARALMTALRRRAGELGLAGQVEFRPNATPAELEALWAGAFALVHPMSGEHFGLVPVEAMARGLPVLAVNNGGPLETVLDGVTGALRPAEPGAFADVLAGWLARPDEAEAAGRAGRERARTLFGTGRFAREMAELAERAVKGGAGR